MRTSTDKVRRVAQIFLEDERDNGKILYYNDVYNAINKAFTLCPRWAEDCDSFEVAVELIRRFRAMCPEY